MRVLRVEFDGVLVLVRGHLAMDVRRCVDARKHQAQDSDRRNDVVQRRSLAELWHHGGAP